MKTLIMQCKANFICKLIYFRASQTDLIALCTTVFFFVLARMRVTVLSFCSYNCVLGLAAHDADKSVYKMCQNIIFAIGSDS